MLKRTQRYSGPRGSTEQLHQKHFVDETTHKDKVTTMYKRRSNVDRIRKVTACKVFLMGLN